jgi:hypothetical protein
VQGKGGVLFGGMHCLGFMPFKCLFMNEAALRQFVSDPKAGIHLDQTSGQVRPVDGKPVGVSYGTSPRPDREINPVTNRYVRRLGGAPLVVFIALHLRHTAFDLSLLLIEVMRALDSVKKGGCLALHAGCAAAAVDNMQLYSCSLIEQILFVLFAS